MKMGTRNGPDVLESRAGPLPENDLARKHRVAAARRVVVVLEDVVDDVAGGQNHVEHADPVQIVGVLDEAAEPIVPVVHPLGRLGAPQLLQRSGEVVDAPAEVNIGDVGDPEVVPAGPKVDGVWRD